MQHKPNCPSAGRPWLARRAEASPRLDRRSWGDGEIVPDDAARPDLRLRTNGHPAGEDCLLDYGARTDADAIPEHRFADDGARADAAAHAEHDVGTDPGAGIDDDVGGNVNRRNDAGMALQRLGLRR